jgi:starch synthase
MFIAMITPECAPAAKVGGLGDVIHGLSKELSIRGHAVEIILPNYDCMRHDLISGLTEAYNDLWVPYYQQWLHCDVYAAFVDGLKCFFIDPHSQHNFFDRGVFYGEPDDGARFAFFCRAALEFMLKTNKHPDIIHCHDWQTALVPVLLYEMYQKLGMSRPRVCYTLHNVGHQGLHGEHILRQVGLSPGTLMRQDRLQDDSRPAAVNLMKGGIVYSNFVTTVSPSYAQEIRHTRLGMGLQRILELHQHKLGGILNGIDYNSWNPEVDPYIARHYTTDSLEDKYANKEALRERLWLRQDFRPLVAFVGRLDPQKGVDLIFHTVPYCLEHGCQFVLLGSSLQGHINSAFWNLKTRFNDHPDCHLEIGYNEELSHLIYAGSDLLLVPSEYEPCGLTQLIGLKYGTLPVVRRTGGLADTVFDADYSTKPYHQRNGYVFNDCNWTGLESALRRAIGLWYHYPQYFRELMINGMRYDYSWNRPGQDYLNIYHHVKAP